MRTPLFRLAAVILIAAFLSFAAVRGGKAMYVGGTAALDPNTQGAMELTDAGSLTFVAKKGRIEIPYSAVSSLEYGQKAGRRVGVAVAISPFALLSKKRKHYLTVAYQGADGASQGAVFELAKGVVGAVVKTLEVKSGKSVEFESEEARKHFVKEAK